MPKSRNRRKSPKAQQKKDNREKHHQNDLKGPMAYIAKKQRENNEPVDYIPLWAQAHLP